MPDERKAAPASGWMSDVQRAIALILIGTFALISVAATVRIVFLGDVAALTDMAKTLQAALVNMGLIALGFFFGSNLSKMQADAGQQRMVDRLTANGPAPAVVVAWWSVLTEAERAAITNAAASDPQTAAFIATAQAGKATPHDLANLVSKGLLTEARAAEIESV